MSYPLIDKVRVFNNSDGYVLNVSPASQPCQFVIAMPVAPGYRMFMPSEQAPALALAILQAAGVQPHAGTQLCLGDRRDMWAVRYLTDHVEAQAEDAAEQELTRRRDELAIKCGATRLGYADTFDSTQRAIDMIIQLQDEATK